MDRIELENRLQRACKKNLSACSDAELWGGLLSLVQEMAAKKETGGGKKKLYYISAEFLIGKLLSNNLINLGIYQDVKEILAAHGKSLSQVEEAEPEPSLEMAGWAAWPPASSTPSPPWGLTGTAWASTITSASLSSSLRTISRWRCPIPGSRTAPG